ncbi:MAG: hypothetical protein IBX69_01630 [Anaerolineales bacterium]|nr:hypothetical protein [Anaerolineales bacterium]
MGDQVMINVELTNYSSPLDPLPEKVAEIVIRHNLEDKMLFSSFNPIALRKINRILPESPIGLLVLKGIKGKPLLGRLGKILVPYQSLHSEISTVSHHLITKVHKFGNRIIVYTVNQVNEMQRLFTLRVDGILTDDPLLARQVLVDINH